MPVSRLPDRLGRPGPADLAARPGAGVPSDLARYQAHHPIIRRVRGRGPARAVMAELGGRHGVVSGAAPDVVAEWASAGVYQEVAHV